ncbi:hypothetical protein FSP39_016692 [Pinctada imbricata]|uniref:Wiskott-Aldrich syndrome protein n=1 Tax=Pinctada imbricata TaxID=66713 RepID=A0AA88YBE0_PINIB|nr:hypothetical protein FSP39_016692 [Pinctada imbricata]
MPSLKIMRTAIKRRYVPQNKALLPKHTCVFENSFGMSQAVKALGMCAYTLASGIAQLYTADPPTRQRWSKRTTGVACFIKDNSRRSYFIRVYDIKKGCAIWEQEIYNNFRYKSPREYFHTFEADDVQAGLNFASEDEAQIFKKAVEQKLLERHQRRIERRRKNQSVHGSSSQAQPPMQTSISITPAPSGPSSPPIDMSTRTPSSTSLNKDYKDKKSKKDKKKKLTKQDIGTPTDFRHVNHVGWDPDKGFEMANLDEDMKSLFQKVGITDDQQVDKETLDFIYDFVDKHGGIEQVKKEMARPPPPPAPVSHPPPPPRTVQSRPPPAGRQPTSAPPPPPSRPGIGAPPPPPSRARGMGAPPAPPSHGPPPPPPQSAKAPPMMASSSAPAAPPPPPAPAPPPPPPAPPAAGGPPPPPVPSDGRSALLSSIREGMSLNKVTPNENRKAGGGRGNLLDEIKAGASLKHVDDQEERPKSNIESQGGIAGALAKALKDRQKRIQGSDDEDESDDEEVDDDDEEWDD